MKQTLRLGRVAGIPVGLHWSVLAILVLLAQSLAMIVLPATSPGTARWLSWTVAIVVAALFLVCLLAHELAHAVVARRMGMRVERVTLWLLGGVAELGGQPATPRADLLIAGVGPLTSLVAGGVVFAVAMAGAEFLPAVWTGALVWLAWINVVLAVFNLAPAAPLDGGRVLRALLWRRWGDQARAQAAATRAGGVFGAALIALGLVEVLTTGSFAGIWLALVGWFLTGASAAERRANEVTSRLAQVPVRAAMNPAPAVGEDRQSVQEFLSTVASHSRERAFPVVDPFGHPIGLVGLSALGQVPYQQRWTVPLAKVVSPARMTVEVDKPLTEVAMSMVPGAGPALVVDHGTLVGVLTEQDIARAMDLAGLQALPMPAGSGADLGSGAPSPR
ncbi:MAG TPA: site-2 protease family protein [Micromonosporaceae bacterium]